MIDFENSYNEINSWEMFLERSMLEKYPDSKYAKSIKDLRLALRIADKVMQEPSDAMQDAFVKEHETWNDPTDYGFISPAFRAMIEQMMRELDTNEK